MISALLLVASVSIAAGECGAHADIAGRLADHGYQIAGHGVLQGGETLLELYLTPTGEWAVLLTRAVDRLACLKATGPEWTSSAVGEEA